MLHYLAKFSSVVDLLATPAEELLQVYMLALIAPSQIARAHHNYGITAACENSCTVLYHTSLSRFISPSPQMDWQRLCSEFPVLHPAQLHFILSHYLLPPSSQVVPTHWTPTKEDALHALNTSEPRVLATGVKLRKCNKSYKTSTQYLSLKTLLAIYCFFQ